jgi:hypothetical protein
VECADDVEACVDVSERAGDVDDMRDTEEGSLWP